ncbi:glycosyltransferase [uncultured Victivallis sp.]|uniref:glycosyltransferase n=1 Tax=uncultured Victivallis sp. TaxID=354118 RepID=UPI0025D51800|nr:glycosyltransferase [uncultured Victivallis sp.]
MSETPLVSVVSLAYNHAKFIREMLESVVTQKTDFPFELLVHDDASTDGTAEIIREYEAKYPEIVKPIYQTENQWRKPGHTSKLFIYPKIRGKYVAFCDGDDYWTSPDKLQKQVDFLEAHPDYSMCFHPVEIRWEGDERPPEIFPSPGFRFHKKSLTFRDLKKHNFIQTNSVMYRWRFHRDPLSLIPDRVMPGDHFLHLLHAAVGKIGFLDETMSVYRKHSGGIWHDARRSDEFYLQMGILMMNFHTEAMKQFPTRCNRLAEVAACRILADRMVRAALVQKAFDRLRILADTYPEYYRRAIEKGQTGLKREELRLKIFRYILKKLPLCK